MDYNAILETLGSTAIVVAAIAFVAKAIFNQMLKNASAAHSTALQIQANEKKATLENDLKKQTDSQLMAQQAAFNKQMEVFKLDVARDSAKVDRIRDEVVRWSNPILMSIEGLRARLGNILVSKAYPLLSEKTGSFQKGGWSATYDYFFPSTLFLFCQYFCWIRLLEKDLSFEIFEKHEVKDSFFRRIRAAGRKLSSFPLDELRGLPDRDGDRQVFTLQQQLLGEVVMVTEGTKQECMSYAAFLDAYETPEFRKRLEPLIYFLDSLGPAHEHRWRRLELFRDGLVDLSKECRKLLKID